MAKDASRSLLSSTGVDRHPATPPIASIVSDDNNVNNSRHAADHLQRPVRPMAAGSDGVQDLDDMGRVADPSNQRSETTDKKTTSESTPATNPSSSSAPGAQPGAASDRFTLQSAFAKIQKTVVTFSKFIGPGFMIAVAYSTYLPLGDHFLSFANTQDQVDPGNYATDIAAGASYRFRLLFIVLLSNLFAILLQGLSLKLGSVTGLDLAQACRAFLPRWLNLFLYVLAEVAIIATDMAEVIGTAIAINLLIPQVPLIAGCAISILDVMIILLFYKPNDSIKGLRLFEYFVVALVLTVVVCFCVQMSMIKSTTVCEVFRGYLPSGVIIEQQALYQACGILGATVMPHSLYLGSGTVQPRLKEYDKRMGLLAPEHVKEKEKDQGGSMDIVTYVPSLAAIKHCM